MAFLQYGKRRSFKRNEHVDVVARELTVFPGTDDEAVYLDIREYIKSGEIYGNGLVIPIDQVDALIEDLVALKRTEVPS